MKLPFLRGNCIYIYIYFHLILLSQISKLICCRSVSQSQTYIWNNDNKKEMLNVVESSHISKVWYWEVVYHLLRDTNCYMQFWCWRVSVFPYLIPLPLYICVCLINKKRILNVVESSHIGKVWYWEGVYHLLRDTNCCMQFWCWCVSVFPCLIPYIYVCVFNK